MKTVVKAAGYDPGYGNEKLCINGETAVLQTAVARPRDIGMAATGMKTARRAVEVRLEGRTRYMVGQDAWHWGEPLTSMDYSALASPERRALLYAVIAQLLGPGTYTFERLVIGLPVPLLQDQTQAEAVFGSLRALKGEHQFIVDDGYYHVTIHKLTVLAQPVGAYADWMLNDDLQPRSGAKRSEVAVLDLGMNTLDLFVVDGGRVSPRFIGGAKVGVRRLLELMNSNGHDLAELDAALRRGRLRPSRTERESWLAEILANLERTWPNLRRFDAVIPTGGGAAVLGSDLQNALAAKGAAVWWPSDPITANVRGLWKWGQRRV